ncbi:MAG: hypothetical protein FWC87_04675 [Acidimicrobiaceae bacterium]|nr:hypothetical protein [Acidimicrobiaceae bacterium]
MEAQRPEVGDGESRGLLEDWRAEVGDDEIVRIATEARREADSGVAPSFTDRDSLLAYLQRRAKPPA